MVTREQVEHIAHLAHLRLDAEELEALRGQLSAILEYMAVLREVDTSAVPPTAQILPLENVTRPDVPAASLPPEEALHNAPDEQGGLFRVPPVME